MSRRYVDRVHGIRQRCLRRIYTGKITPLTDCITGTDDPSLAHVSLMRDQLGIVIPQQCSGVDLANLQFPGQCEVSGPFDVVDLEECVAKTLDDAITDMLEIESPAIGLLPSRALPCALGVARHGLGMVRQEVRAREQCLLTQDRGPVFGEPLTCRAPLPPYGEGTGLEDADRGIISGYINLLAGIPADCKYTRLDRVGYDEGCDDLTGGRFTPFDLKLCVFESNRASANHIIDAAFPREPECGNGEVESGEECDDGNSVQTDNCLNNCTAAKCGDGQVRTGAEECDDGNTSQTDACLNNCKAAKCGDSQVRAGVEDCDDGNTSQTDPCLNNCKAAKCGDGQLCTSLSPRCTSGPDAGPEVCDDGNVKAGDGCNAQCGPEFCGDGVTQSTLGEECDDGLANSNTTPDACRGNCKNPRCGDDVVDSGEGCDPPNGTTCSATCTALLCGNGDLDDGEECDDGPSNSDTTPDACRINCTLPRCGDGVTDPSKNETCDDGNTSQTDACLNDCVAATCGDGQVRAGIEECDDGNTSQTDACLNDCKAAKCGDGQVRTGVEECDDGNTTPTDVCLNNCKTATCGDGQVCSAGACTTGPTGGAEQCDAGTGNSDTTPNACRTDCAAAGCGDGVVDNGEQCDGVAGSCPGGAECGATCTCANECPGIGELTILSANGRLCSGDGDCLAGSCIGGRCRTDSRLDTGMTGLSHAADITDGVLVRGFIECGGSFPCGECQVTGIDPSTGSCRCANDNRQICDEPFVADNDDCAGQVCNCYFGPPLALSSGNTPACIVNRFGEDVFGTANVDEGSGAITTRLRSVVYLGEELTRPCPYCTGDPVANDGVRGGTCVLGTNNGQPCDTNAINTTFPAPDGDGHSIDCFPNAGKNVSGQGLRIELTQTTGRDELKISGDVICGFPNIPALRRPCWCLQCSGDPSVSCTTHAECEALGIGRCTSTGGAQLPTSINSCDGACVPVNGSEVLGQCDDAGPNDTFCDAVVRANGEGYIQCQSNADCLATNIGIDAGVCSLVTRRPCFLDPIVAIGEANPSTPLGAAAFCVPPTANPAINTVAGIPGPGRVLSQVHSTLFCASDLTKVYTPGVGGCSN